MITKILSITALTKQLAVNLSEFVKKRKFLKRFYNKDTINDKLIIF